MNEIVIPRNTLIVLCGPAACGKSTWAAKHFLPTQIVSSDTCRAMIIDDATDQSISRHAFDVMYYIIEKRLGLGRLAVADATNLKREHRTKLLRIAQRFQFNTALVVFNLPVELCLDRNAARKRKVPRDAILDQYDLLRETLRTLTNELFTQVHVLDELTQSNGNVRIGRFVNRPPRPRVP